ncbi:cupin domain-containing protein [Actinoplanes sp. NEAU-A12]|uniref:Cupin domain-containing protein n=1 Tax=Actinoplanes sandaracinus TaxID=3045177 RepID=A0ABT6WG69_9ACTN|nr:cupin domain-containing protein [Actinoplanes sandaracinus]MDI6098728.1 cupin domain-containing protein [Actinoplanes sandaracinus]
MMESTSLAGLTEQHLAIARQAPNGRSAHTVHGGHTKTLRQTLIALAGGQRLDEHESPGEATLQVLHGHVRLLAGAEEQSGASGDLLTIPGRRHSLEAVHDSVVLLTVVKTDQQ